MVARQPCIGRGDVLCLVRIRGHSSAPKRVKGRYIDTGVCLHQSLGNSAGILMEPRPARGVARSLLNNRARVSL
jgi:hypothetical protein